MLQKTTGILLTVCGVLTLSAQNLLWNGDFSSGLKGWQIRKKNGISIEEKSCPGGKNALKAITGKAGLYGANYSVSGKKLKPDTDYTASGWIKTEGNAQVYLYFCRSPQANKYHASSQVFTSSTDWTAVHVLLNSGKAKSMVLLLRVVGQGTAYFGNLAVREGNHVPKENMFLNSDFAKLSRYKEVPDNWTCAVQTPVAESENFIHRLVKVPPPVPGAGVLECKNVMVTGNLAQQFVPGRTYTYSFYAKNGKKGVNTPVTVRFDKKRFDLVLTDHWKRYTFTVQAQGSHITKSLRAKVFNASFYFSAPQMVLGSEAVPWVKPAANQKKTVLAIKEAVAEVESLKISGNTPSAGDWAKAPPQHITHITKGSAQGLFASQAKILHNSKNIFVRFEGKKSPLIKTGNTEKLDWYSICDTFELFLTDTALDGTYIQYAVNTNGHDATYRNGKAESLGITSKVTHTKDSWSAVITLPLSNFRTNANWKAAFCRGYDHKNLGRQAYDWSLPKSRGNTAFFGILKGISVPKVASLELEKLYAAPDRSKLFYRFNGFREEMKRASLQITIENNGKAVWKKTQLLSGSSGTILLDKNFEKDLNSATRITLHVVGKNGKDYFRAGRKLYLCFSSYAKHHAGMDVYPLYDIFTEKDKSVVLKVKMDRKSFDKLRITLRDEKGKMVYRGETVKDLSIPPSKIPYGFHTIQVQALRQGKIMEERAHETFRKLPYKNYMVRMNRMNGCLQYKDKGILPMFYYPCGSSTFSFDPDLGRNPERMIAGAGKLGFHGIKAGFGRGDIKRAQALMTLSARYNMPFLVDLEFIFPKGYYSAKNNLSGPETEKVMIRHMQQFQKFTAGKDGIFAYAPYHEPGYYRSGRGIVDSYRVPMILKELKKVDPYRPVTGFWAPPHWDENGEPFGSVDGVDFFIVDVYTRNLKAHCDELFRIAKASKTVHKPLGQIFNTDNLASDFRECPTPDEYQAELYTALIAGYRVFYIYIGIAPVKETWRKIVECNRQLDVLSQFLGAENCEELFCANEENVCYSVYRKGKEVMVLAASKSNDRKTRLHVDLAKLVPGVIPAGKERIQGTPVRLENGKLTYTFQPAGSAVWIFPVR